MVVAATDGNSTSTNNSSQETLNTNLSTDVHKLILIHAKQFSEGLSHLRIITHA